MEPVKESVPEPMEEDTSRKRPRSEDSSIGSVEDITAISLETALGSLTPSLLEMKERVKNLNLLTDSPENIQNTLTQATEKLQEHIAYITSIKEEVPPPLKRQRVETESTKSNEGRETSIEKITTIMSAINEMNNKINEIRNACQNTNELLSIATACEQMTPEMQNVFESLRELSPAPLETPILQPQPTVEERPFDTALGALIPKLEEMKDYSDRISPTTSSEEEIQKFLQHASEMIDNNTPVFMDITPPSPKARTQMFENMNNPEQIKQTESIIKTITLMTKMKQKVEQIQRTTQDTNPMSPFIDQCDQIITQAKVFISYLERFRVPHPNNIPERADFDALQRALEGTTPSPEEAKRIELMLTAAIGNSDLNMLLRNKDRKQFSKAEQFLYDLTFTTMKAPSAAEQLTKIQTALSQIDAPSFNADVKTYYLEELDTLTAVGNLLENIRKQKPKWSQRPEAQKILRNLKQTAISLEYGLHTPPFSQVLESDRRTLLSQLHEEVTALTNLPNFPQGNKAWPPIIQNIETLIPHFTKCWERKMEFETRLKNESIKPPLTLQDCWILRRYSDLTEKLDKLGKEGIAFASPQLTQLKTQSKGASEQLAAFRSLFESLPNYATGDVVLVDDGRDTASRGEKQITTVEQAKKAFQTVFKATEGDFNAAVWPLRGFGGKGLLHVAYSFMENDNQKTLEMGDTCEQDTLELLDAITAVQVRPNFLRMLTPKGLEAIRKSNPEATDEQIQHWIMARYVECQQRYFKENEARFKTLNNENAVHALEAYTGGRPLSEQPTDTPLGQLFAFAKELLVKYAKSHETGPMPETPSGAQPKKATEKLCSELVGEIVSETESMLDKELQERLGISEPVLTPTLNPEKVYAIDTLVQDLCEKGAFSLVPEPLAIRLCVQLPPLCEFLRKDIAKQ